jgi:hypothetical protein
MKTILHQPKLNTIRMVEQKLKKKEQFRTKHELFKSLNGKVMYPTITAILDYLEESYKIAYRKNGSIVWVFKGSVNGRKQLRRLKGARKPVKKPVKNL